MHDLLTVIHSLALLVPAIVVHLLRIRSRQPEARQEGFQGLRTCIELVEGLKQSCSAAHRVVRLLAPALEKSGCNLEAALYSSKRRPEPAKGTTDPVSSLQTASFTTTTPEFSVQYPLHSHPTPDNLTGETRLACNTITPPASPGQLVEGSSCHSLALNTMSADSISPSTTQMLEQPQLPIYTFDSGDIADPFASLDTVGMADWSREPLFGDLDPSVTCFMNCPVDMDWVEGLLNSTEML